MRKLASITNELAQLIDRRAELIDTPTETRSIEEITRDLLKSGTDPKTATLKASELKAAALHAEIEAEAVENRILEVIESELSTTLRNRRDKAIAGAEARLENSRLKWMSGQGLKLFDDELVRERVFIFSAEAEPAIAELERAVAMPTFTSVQELRWSTSRVQRPGYRELAKLSPRTSPEIYPGDGGSGCEDLGNLVAILQQR